MLIQKSLFLETKNYLEEMSVTEATKTPKNIVENA
jgi:hypothetical protein